jgi:hypothetical protein
MDIHGSLRISVDLHGYPWVPVDLHGHPCYLLRVLPLETKVIISSLAFVTNFWRAFWSAPDAQPNSGDDPRKDESMRGNAQGEDNRRGNTTANDTTRLMTPKGSARTHTHTHTKLALWVYFLVFLE